MSTSDLLGQNEGPPEIETIRSHWKHGKECPRFWRKWGQFSFELNNLEGPSSSVGRKKRAVVFSRKPFPLHPFLTKLDPSLLPSPTPFSLPLFSTFSSNYLCTYFSQLATKVMKGKIHVFLSFPPTPNSTQNRIL